MALLFLTNDVALLQFAEGFGQPDEVSLPTLKKGDIIDITYRAVTPSGNPLAPHALLDLSGYSLIVSIGTEDNPLAQQATFAASSDGFSLRGSLSLNTAGISALDDGAASTFEAQLTNGSTAIHSTQARVTIKGAVNSAGSLVPIAGDTALGRTEADRLFLRRAGRPGERFILTSEDGTKSGEVYWDNDGTFRAEALS